MGKHFSNKHFSKKRRRNVRAFETAEIIEFQHSKFEAERALPPIKALNPTQAAYLDALRTSPQVVVLGPAGTGKTWIAATHAADLFRNGRIDKIILTRPNVPCGRSLGYFPGTLEDKFAPWAAPVVEAIKERIGKAAYEIALKNGDIETGAVRGDARPIVEERLRAARRGAEHHAGRDQDVPHPHRRGLHRGRSTATSANAISTRPAACARCIHLIKSQMLPVPVIEFTRDDIVRSGVCAMWVRAFDEANL